MRRSGVLMPVFSLPSPYGIGTFSKEAFEFVDMLAEAGQSVWQILPLGPTGFGASPYQSYSTFAGNPSFIDLVQLIECGWLTEEECDLDWGSDKERVDYEKVETNRTPLLRLAFERSNIESCKEFHAFCEENKEWLDDYALYRAVKDYFDGAVWKDWDEDIRLRKPEAMAHYKEKLAYDVRYYQFQQYLFAKQWMALKKHANEKGVKIFGDIPIYVAFDSADTWGNPELFQLDEENVPLAVAGCPPDAFSATGQLWNNPLYDWEYHKKTGYAWWIQRIAYCFKLHDIVRIDHFRAFEAYYSIPYGDETAMNGHWVPGPGMDVFHAIHNALGEVEIIAEDLGYLTEGVYELLRETGYPGMKVLHFAFNAEEKSNYLTHEYDRNCVVYTGTHDNNTTQGWYRSMEPVEKSVALRYLNNFHTPLSQIHWDYIALAMRSVADLCMIPAMDYLGLGEEARINTPSTVGTNWQWRMKKNAFQPELVEKMRKMARLYGRI